MSATVDRDYFFVQSEGYNHGYDFQSLAFNVNMEIEYAKATPLGGPIAYERQGKNDRIFVLAQAMLKPPKETPNAV